MERIRCDTATKSPASKNDDRLLIPSTETQHKLGDTSSDTIRRLEQDGILTIVRLRKGGRKYHKLVEVEALAARGVG